MEKTKILQIDGSFGEGGGQILRTSLSLSILTAQAIEIINLRAKRKNPGLQRQHLVCLEAAQKISGAKVSGAFLNSKFLRFEPRKIRPGKYEFDIGTAGSTTLVAETILLPLTLAKRPSEILIIGGTHNPLSPPFHYFSEVFLETLRTLNLKVRANLEKWGFYPQGGGRIRLFIEPSEISSTSKITKILERGELKSISGLSVVANLPVSIALRQKDSLIKELKPFSLPEPEIEIEEIKTLSAGTFLFLKLIFEDNLIAGFSGLGKIGKRAEEVGKEVVQQFKDYWSFQKAFDPYLADQLILYLALAKKPFSFTTSRITSHLTTIVWLLEKFLNLKISIDQEKKIVNLA